MVIKRTKSRVKQKVTETPASSSSSSGKRADLKMRSGLNLLLLAEKKAREGWDSSATTLSPGSVSLTKTVSFSAMPTRTDSAERSEMSNSALLQLAEMCTSELRSATKDKLPSACAGVPYQINPSVLGESALPHSHSNSSLSWHETGPPPEKRACQWSFAKAAAVSVCSSSTTGSRGEDAGNRNSFLHSCLSAQDSLSPQNSPAVKLRCTSIEPRWNLDDKYASIEKYRSASSGRKLSSSATESIPSPSSSFGDEAEEDGVPVFSSQPEQSKDHKFSANGGLDQTNLHCSFTAGFSSKLVANVNTHKSLSHHNPCPHQHQTSALQPHPPQHQTSALQPHPPQHQTSALQPHPPQHQTSALQPHPPKQKQSLKHHQLQQTLTASAGPVSRPLFLKETEAATAPDKQSSCMLRQNVLLSMNTVQPSELHADKNLDINSEDKCHSNFQKWREPVNPVKRLGETSASSEPPPSSSSSKIVGEGPSPVIKMNFTEWRQQHCSEWQSVVGKIGCESGNNPATHSHDLNSSSTACHVSSTKTASLLSDGRLASLLSKTDSPKDKFSLGVSDMFHSRQGTDHHETKHLKTCLKSAQAAFSKPRERSIPDLKLPSAIRNSDSKMQSLPDNVNAGCVAMNLTFSNQAATFSKGKLKKKWTERMLVEAKQEEHLGQHQSTMKSECQVSGVTTASLDVRPDSKINANHQSGPAIELSSLTNTNNCEVLLGGQPNRTEEIQMVKSFEAKTNNRQTKFELNHTPGYLRHPTGLFKPGLVQTQEPTSFNASRHPKLLFQLSQNPQFSKPDHLKLQTSLGNVQIKSEQDGSWTNPHKGQHLFSFKHQHAMSGLGMKKEVKDDIRENSSMDLTYKSTLNHIAACGKRCVDHIVEQLYKTDFSVESQQFSKRCSDPADNFTNDRSSSTAIMRSEVGQEKGVGVAGLKEETCGGLVKNEDQLDFSVMTASSLVEKVIRKWRDGCSEYSKVDQESLSGRHVQFSEGSNVAVNTDLLSSMVASEVCHDSSQNETDPCRQSLSAHAESCGHTDITEPTSPKPIRKSRRANRGKKYQELIKEGVIQPSRERLAARNAEKHGQDLGDSGQNKTSPLPVCSLELPSKRKTRRRRCDSETVETVETGHITNTEVTSGSSGASLCAKVSPSCGPGSRVKVETLGTGKPTPHITLQKKDLPTQPVTGSQKRKARKHCITRISILKEDKEA